MGLRGLGLGLQGFWGSLGASGVLEADPQGTDFEVPSKRPS